MAEYDIHNYGVGRIDGYQGRIQRRGIRGGRPPPPSPRGNDGPFSSDGDSLDSDGDLLSSDGGPSIGLNVTELGPRK